MVRHLIIADSEQEVDALHADEVYRATVVLRNVGEGYLVIRHPDKKRRGKRYWRLHDVLED